MMRDSDRRNPQVKSAGARFLAAKLIVYDS